MKGGVYRMLTIEQGHTAQTGNGRSPAVGCNPPLHHFKDGILGWLSCLVSGIDGEETYHLVLLAGGDDGEILHIAENALSGA